MQGIRKRCHGWQSNLLPQSGYETIEGWGPRGRPYANIDCSLSYSNIRNEWYRICVDSHAWYVALLSSWVVALSATLALVVAARRGAVDQAGRPAGSDYF